MNRPYLSLWILAAHPGRLVALPTPWEFKIASRLSVWICCELSHLRDPCRKDSQTKGRQRDGFKNPTERTVERKDSFENKYASIVRTMDHSRPPFGAWWPRWLAPPHGIALGGPRSLPPASRRSAAPRKPLLAPPGGLQRPPQHGRRDRLTGTAPHGRLARAEGRLRRRRQRRHRRHRRPRRQRRHGGEVEEVVHGHQRLRRAVGVPLAPRASEVARRPRQGRLATPLRHGVSLRLPRRGGRRVAAAEGHRRVHGGRQQRRRRGRGRGRRGRQGGSLVQQRRRCHRRRWRRLGIAALPPGARLPGDMQRSTI